MTTASGTAAEVCEKLRILTAIFPKGATLAEVATATRNRRNRKRTGEEMKRKHEQQAKEFCEAIKQLASRAEALENFEYYLSFHFAEWMKKRGTPDGITEELKYFSAMEF